MHTIDSLAKVEKACLDSGYGMMGCVEDFQFQMDSLIQLSLKKLYAKCNKEAKLILQKDQADWLKRQKIYNKKIAIQEHNELVKEHWEGGEVERISILGKQTDFILKRAKFLVKKLNNH